MSRKPLIGLTPFFNGEADTACVRPTYSEAIKRAGGIPVVIASYSDLTDFEDILDSLDGILFTGGEDVDPNYYGENIEEFCGDISPDREKLEFPLMKLCIEKDKPFMAVCRGMQVMNCACGGTLYQDLKIQGGATFNHSNASADGKLAVHSVSFAKGGFLEKVLGIEGMRVNSWHHQAVKDLGEGLEVTATSFDGLVEGITIPGKKCAFGVQWHPEKMPGSEAEPLFKYFVEKCK